MSDSYEQRITDICSAAGVPDLADEMIAGGVSGNTLAIAIRNARGAGATDLRAAVRTHQGVAAQLRYSGASPVTTEQPHEPASGDDHGWQAAFERVAPAAGETGEKPAASHQVSWQTAFERAQHG